MTDKEIIEELRHKISCLENYIERIENLPKGYEYLINVDWDDMNEIEREISYKAIPAAKLQPVEDYPKFLGIECESMSTESINNGLGINND